ncbi:adenosylmethionine-8-amino-7-oxononanoate aminotransferase [Syncephalis pseudoplumigaleata]|uniref:Adenosylmethionine-8-amino-7-oxononanoate aminotransferase n=1 Tax=Syncephalis pseudoplumigaleata TaxID=1712513 RepID=A0A4P9Z4Z0_9FUNG|nr:adenosylmethionine-8-amino-7-oxononanoate aminotransferase [Syncephalis pseudoplumigaleata]|eukprot:RKP27586.1 adenosylmethionine-8-amino-7-oxononanoate aminotransferase [Syncephalis pseudoplumigaleata]
MTSRSPVWHPFTQHAVQPDPTLIARGEGAWLEAADGRRIFDAISSWWVVTHGHRHPRIVQAIKDQVDKLDQVIFAGFTHEPAEKLARHLVAITPPELEYVFFSDSGSTSVEVALKMALGYWRHLGAKRSRILALEGAYHGDTIGGMSVGERGVFNAPYDPLLFDVERIPFPVSGREQATFDALDAACKRSDVAALIVEPLILGAGGMLIYPPAVLAEMKRVCEVHNVLFIADEAGIAPDIACYSKGLTGGSVPLAVTLCRAGIFDAHYSTDRSKTFFHSSSYTANPIACAAALANLEIWQSEPVMDRINSLAAMHKERLARFRGDRRFADVRQIGTIAALDIVAKDAGYLADIGPRLYRGFLARGLLIRPLGNTVYLMPPYSTTASDLDQAYNAIDELAGEVA